MHEKALAYKMATLVPIGHIVEVKMNMILDSDFAVLGFYSQY